MFHQLQRPRLWLGALSAAATIANGGACRASAFVRSLLQPQRPRHLRLRRRKWGEATSSEQCNRKAKRELEPRTFINVVVCQRSNAFSAAPNETARARSARRERTFVDFLFFSFSVFNILEFFFSSLPYQAL
jgi:hypothetical protein